MGGNSSAGGNNGGSVGGNAPPGGLASSAVAGPGAHNAMHSGGAGESSGGFDYGPIGYTLGLDGTLNGPRGFDSPGFSLSRSNPANDHSGQNAVAEAQDLNDAMRQLGLIDGAKFAENRENIYSGEVGKLNGLLASSLRDAYSPRMTGLKDMFKNMFTTPEKVDTPYSALNSLISSGYAAPAEDGTGFKATPRAALGMLSNLAPTLGIVRGVVTGNPAAAMPSPMSVVTGIPSAIGLANQMQVAGITPAKSSGTSGDSVDSRGGGGGNGVFNADAQYAASMNSPLVAGSTIDPAAWFANRRGLLG